MKNYYFLIIFFIPTIISLPQTSSLTGKIIDQYSKQAVPFVNIGLADTYFGTSANEHGAFKISLNIGKHNLIISCVGYETKLLQVFIPEQKELLISLKPVTIELPEVIVNSDENPAYAIIRKAIANREKNSAGLSNYFYNFYSKNILKSGKEIVFIEEDIGEGLNNLVGNVKEIKTKLYHTENISKKTFSESNLNILENGIIDFTADSLIIGDEFVFHLPLSKFAFSYYDYELLGIKQSDQRYFYHIKVIPYSNIRPTFAGEILIDDSTYALTGVDLKFISRNFLPFTNLKLSVFQKLEQHKNYWLPKYYNIDVETTFNYYYLFSLDSAITSYIKVFNNYQINVDENSPLLKTINQLADTSFKHEPEFVSLSKMDSIRLYPITINEQKAYTEIDSNKTILSSLKLGGIGGKYVKESEQERIEKDTAGFNLFSVLEYLSFRNNRIDGIALGLQYSNLNTTNLFGVSAETNYSFLRKDVNSMIEFKYYPKEIFFDNISFFGFYESKPAFVFSPYSNFMNAISVSLGFEDQFDYYLSKGVGLNFQKNLSDATNIKFGFTFENQNSLEAKKYYSIFNAKQFVRPNLVTGKGIDNRFIINFNSGTSPYDFQFLQQNGLVSQVDFSSKLFGSDFNYTKINAAYQFYFDTFYDELLFAPYLGIMIEGSAVLGNYNQQHLETPQTSLGIFAPFGTFKGLTPYQFISDKRIALHIEHNWRKTFFDMLGIYFPVEWNIELTTGVSLLNLWNGKKLIDLQKSKEFYWESYAGISGIFGLLSINVVYNKFDDVVVRLGLTKVL
ncbi:MAG: carboxypeptidase-like regulatory domain-containing protein [Ignavibacteriales bacterium]|nr:carboxypeptidase-like regulatory domain-containing protein [Ignavibacteriales bacterium]